MSEHEQRSDWFRRHPDQWHGPYPDAFLALVDRVDAQHRARAAALEEPGAVTLIGTQVLVVRQAVWWREYTLRRQAQAASEHRARCREISARV